MINFTIRNFSDSFIRERPDILIALPINFGNLNKFNKYNIFNIDGESFRLKDFNQRIIRNKKDDE